ncbi:putative fructose-bisphosphate aldolase protein [Phaeoacremonium minimum UCRPA7]|uniref:Putative fructose-bisphosphate aldolase protein n=1 Tax=Phaeoacremonium minimum (strain UCR-PA7) TaxID=1286976 RepID=R8BT05_PHAM7|nr:putative fructose-bisphosphate aldolase protein [Phaeoacremonium minimum UCRPA7]EOO02434.1 putative fructose-bisphosphate aldolase protein [Phaeoacremonium minimum UCRPA7]
MATPLMTRSPTCLTCLRRISQTICSGSPASLTQVRGKKTSGRPTDRGVLVRLLEDVPKFGRKDTIFRTERGRMRNIWYPRKQAEYMTTARFAELGLTNDSIGERDPLFGVSFAREGVEETEEVDAAARPMVEGVSPQRAHELLSTILPETIVFRRKLIHPPSAPAAAPTANTPSAPRSPLLAAQAAVSAASRPTDLPEPNYEPTEKTEAVDPTAALAIFGSVSTTDIAAAIKEILVHDTEAARIMLDGRDVRFVGMEDGADRVKMLGRWEVEIIPRGEASGLESVKKVVEVIAESE